MILMGASPGWAADIIYSPGNCAPADLVLHVSNKTNAMQRVWTQTREGGQVKELHFDLSPRQTIQISGRDFLSQAQAFSMKSWEKDSLRIRSQCGREAALPLTSSVSPDVDHFLPGTATTVELSLVNLYLRPQSGELQFLNSKGELLQRQDFHLQNYYETQTLNLDVPQGASRLHISGAERLHSQVKISSSQISPGVTLTPRRLPAASSKSYFLVSTKGNNAEESFVMALDNAQQIATAREQIRNPQLEKIVVGGIQLGHGNFNRTFHGVDRAPYSWHMFRVDAFADFAHIDCDGSPDLTEERLFEKINNGGRICFWHYRVVRELSLQEVRSGQFQK